MTLDLGTGSPMTHTARSSTSMLVEPAHQRKEGRQHLQQASNAAGLLGQLKAARGPEQYLF